MAKRRPRLTLEEMEKRLGYSVGLVNYYRHCTKRFYSDLTPVPDDIYERTEIELSEHAKQQYSRSELVSDEILPSIDKPQVRPTSFQQFKLTTLDHCI
jgi:hypothetical protein